MPSPRSPRPVRTWPIRSLAAGCASAPSLVLAATGATGATAEEILGFIDAMKLRSSMTLFHRAAPEEPIFAQVLHRFFDGQPDDLTDERLSRARPEG